MARPSDRDRCGTVTRWIPGMLAALLMMAGVPAGRPGHSPASVGQALTVSDTVAIRLATLQELDPSGALTAPGRRLWIQGEIGEGGAYGPVSRDVLAGLRDALADVAVGKPGEDFFVCPPGRAVELPGEGCPIRESGLIVAFRRIQLHGESVETGGVLTFGAPDGSLAGAKSVQLLLRREGGAWVVERVLDRSIT